jgi:NADH dehydrogenase
MPGRVFVTGGSGFVGSAVIDELTTRGFGVNALINQQELSVANADVRQVRGGLFDPAALDAAMADCQTAIHLVGIIMEKPARGITFQRIHVDGARNVVEAVVRRGLRRYAHMSALGTRENAVSNYHQTKWQAEQIVRASGLDWTIIRPSLIHGPGGEFMKMEAKWARKKAPPFLFMPYFGSGILGLGGAGMLQPVYVRDVARAFVDALEKPQTIGQVYNLGGSQQMSWPQMHKMAARAILGKNRWAAALPAWYAKFLAAITPTTFLPFNRDQVIMSQEDNTADLADFIRDFGWTPRGFEQTLAEYSSSL